MNRHPKQASPFDGFSSKFAEPILAEMRLLRQAFERAMPSHEPPKPAAKWLTVADVASQLSLSKSRVYELCNEGQMRSIKDGRSIRIPLEEPERWSKQKLRQR